MKHAIKAIAMGLALIAAPALDAAPGARDEAQVIMPEEPAALALWEDWGLADAIVHGDTVWISGVVASRRPGETEPGPAYERAFARIGAILSRAGVGWDDVVEMTTYHTDVTSQMPQFIAAKRKFVRAPYPAWTAIDVDRLIPDNGLVEIRVIARKRQEPVFTPSGMPFPFSAAVEVDGVLYLSGEIGASDDFKSVVPGGIEPETRRMFDRIGANLARHGLGFDDVFKCTVFLADMSEWPAFNRIYAGYFKPGRYPARSALGVNGLALGARVEMECWARRGAGRAGKGR